MYNIQTTMLLFSCQIPSAFLVPVRHPLVCQFEYWLKPVSHSLIEQGFGICSVSHTEYLRLFCYHRIFSMARNILLQCSSNRLRVSAIHPNKPAHPLSGLAASGSARGAGAGSGSGVAGLRAARSWTFMGRLADAGRRRARERAS